MRSCLQWFCEINNANPAVRFLSASEMFFFLFGIYLGLVYNLFASISKTCLFQQRLLQSFSGQAQSKALKAGEVGWIGLYKFNFFSFSGIRKFAVNFHFPFNSVLTSQKRLCLLAESCLSSWPGIQEVCKYTVMIVFSHNSTTVNRLRLCQNGKTFPTSARYRC